MTIDEMIANGKEWERLEAELKNIDPAAKQTCFQAAAMICETQGGNLPDDVCEGDEYRRGQKRASLDCAEMMRRYARRYG